jgi:glycosyltransferase involved in cell wall biosynthesis
LEEIRRAEPFEHDGKLILYIGRLDRYKNVDRAIEAMKYLPEEFQFYIGGTGTYREELKGLIEELNLSGRVKLLGFVAEEDKYRWMKTCDVFINLSSVEAFGMTVLEALAAGAPAVVNAAGGLGEFAEKFGGVSAVRADEVSMEVLAQVVEEATMCEFGEDFAGYDWQNIITNIENIFVNI